MKDGVMEIHEGQIFVNHHGALVRVDIVQDGWICFVSWKPDQVTGRSARMVLDTFCRALIEHEMVEAEN